MAPIQKGSTVLVTGANGFIASHIIDQLLLHGYKVRGTVRTEAKGKWLKQYFGDKYGTDKIEVLQVADVGVRGALDEAVAGVSGVVHVASNVSFSSNPNDVIPSTIDMINHALESCSKSRSVKRFVLTSSSTAATNPFPNKKFDIDESTWNEFAVSKAWAPPPYDDEFRAWNVYGASKTQGEQAMWKFVKEKKPHFEANSILPNANFGQILNAYDNPSTAGWVTTIFKSQGSFPADLKVVPPQYFVDVQDTARLHVATLIDADVHDERIFAFAEPVNWNRLLATLRKLRPDVTFPKNLEDNAEDLSTIVRKGRAEELLKNNFGQASFTGFEESIKHNIAGL